MDDSEAGSLEREFLSKTLAFLKNGTSLARAERRGIFRVRRLFANLGRAERLE